MAQTLARPPAPPPAARTVPAREAPRRELTAGEFARAVGASTAAVALFLSLRLTAWPPHEDESLALYVGEGSLRSVLDTVIGERGGAPLHFLIAWIVEHSGGGLTGLRVVSALFAVASIPLVALLGARLADRSVGALAAALAASSWVLVFHGVYARMYSLFLFTSALSYLALLAALQRGGPRRWGLWAAITLVAVGTHPYGALVLASQGIYVLLARERVRQALVAFAIVGLLGVPFWITDLTLAGRFDVGLGVGEKTGGPVAVAGYLAEVGADFSAGPTVLPAVVALAAFGLVTLARRDRRVRLLVAAVFLTPTLAFLVARIGGTASPETRHVIFALPFFATLVAAGLVQAVRLRPAARVPVALAGALLLGSGVLWAWDKTPLLFRGEPEDLKAGRLAASTWLAETGRPDDLLLGFAPVYLGAWQQSDRFSRLVLPRADARLAAKALREAERPLGRGVWILNGYDAPIAEDWFQFAPRIPAPPAAFEVRTFGPYVVVRSREPTETPERYLRQAAAAMVLGRQRLIWEAEVNLSTIDKAAALLAYDSSESRRSLSTTSR